MTTAQLAIIASTLTAIAALAFSARQQKRALDAQAATHERTLAHETKLARLDRITGPYEAMLELVGHTMETVNATKPILVLGEPPQPPEELDTERIRKVQARIGVHGSPEVKAILEHWSKGTSLFYVEAWKLNEMQGAEQRSMKPSEIKENWGLFPTAQWQVVEAKRKELHAIVRELEDAVSAEMRS
ncbi:MAG: hypothetical protein WEE66_02055 [Actinomycetota bacterium]